jgi:hypothetical protein
VDNLGFCCCFRPPNGKFREKFRAVRGRRNGLIDIQKVVVEMKILNPQCCQLSSLWAFQGKRGAIALIGKGWECSMRSELGRAQKPSIEKNHKVLAM